MPYFNTQDGTFHDRPAEARQRDAAQPAPADHEAEEAALPAWLIALSHETARSRREREEYVATLCPPESEEDRAARYADVTSHIAPRPSPTAGPEEETR